LSLPQRESDLREILHRLNNQLGIVLAHAELLESKALDPFDRIRAAQVVASTLAVVSTARTLRHHTDVTAV
jgi:hypothetical protein